MEQPPLQELAQRVVDFYRRRRRDLPWRRTRDPYAIWVSEIMLQQTRVSTAIPYYGRWMARFPDAAALAAAPLDDVLAVWSGLGYYSRARNLHRGARELVARYGGKLPRSARELRGLPGIGRYTAGAIASMAFGLREPLVDGNVARVLARLYEIDEDIKSAAGTRRLWALAASLVPTRAPGEFNQGLMELGATVCTPTRPGCLVCPLTDLCSARAAGREGELPVTPPRRPATALPLIETAAAWIEHRGQVALGRRHPAGLFGGLWELPQASGRDALAALLAPDAVLVAGEPVARNRRLLTHRRLQVSLFRGRLVGGRRPLAGRLVGARYDRVTWRAPGDLAALALSSAARSLIDQYRENKAWKSTKPRSASSKRATRRSSRASGASATTPPTTTSAARRGARRGDSRS